MQLLLAYRQGRFHWSGEDEFRIGDYLSFDDYPSNLDGIATKKRFEWALKWIARLMIQMRHGGTLLVVPDGEEWRQLVSSIQYMPKLPVSTVRDASAQNTEYRDMLTKSLNETLAGRATPAMGQFLGDDMPRARYVAELEWLARLTGTDGITVIQRDLTLLGFGIMFKMDAKLDTPVRVRVYDAYLDQSPKTIDVAEVGGARHQSAARVCHAIAGAIAIVASQDGSLTSMARSPKEDIVLANGHLELFVV